MATLPLFPLGTVLVPGAVMSLRVFEPRYTALVAHLVDGAGAPEFGVVGLRVGGEVGGGAEREVYPVGTTAVLTHVDRLDGETFRIVVRGERRFRVVTAHLQASPFPVGEVEELPEADGDVAAIADLARLVRRRLANYLDLIGQEEPVPEPPAGPWPASARALSYRVIEDVVLSLAERQALLESPDTRSRLDMARRLLRREIGLIEAVNAVPYQAQPGTPAPN